MLYVVLQCGSVSNSLDSHSPFYHLTSHSPFYHLTSYVTEYPAAHLEREHLTYSTLMGEGHRCDVIHITYMTTCDLMHIDVMHISYMTYITYITDISIANIRLEGHYATHST